MSYSKLEKLFIIRIHDLSKRWRNFTEPQEHAYGATEEGKESPFRWVPRQSE